MAPKKKKTKKPFKIQNTMISTDSSITAANPPVTAPAPKALAAQEKQQDNKSSANTATGRDCSEDLDDQILEEAFRDFNFDDKSENASSKLSSLPTEALYALLVHDNPDAEYELGARFFYGKKGKEKLPTDAVKWLEKAVAHGHKDAQLLLTEAWAYLGYCHLEGRPERDVEKNVEKAIEYLTKAANKNDPDALYDLARCYYYGDGVERSTFQAVTLFQKAIDLHNHKDAKEKIPDAWYYLGDAYSNGKEKLEVNYKAAFKWFKKAADAGHRRAQYEIGYYYLRGRGVKKNPQKAIEWLGKSASAHDPAKELLPEAYYQFGNYQLHGTYQKIPRDPVKAFANLLIAANAKPPYPYALYEVGYCYENGIGVSKNLNKAKEYYEKAANLGIEAAKEALLKIFPLPSEIKDKIIPTPPSTTIPKPTLPVRPKKSREEKARALAERKEVSARIKEMNDKEKEKTKSDLKAYIEIQEERRRAKYRHTDVYFAEFLEAMALPSPKHSKATLQIEAPTSIREPILLNDEKDLLPISFATPDDQPPTLQIRIKLPDVPASVESLLSKEEKIKQPLDLTDTAVIKKPEPTPVSSSSLSPTTVPVGQSVQVTPLTYPLPFTPLQAEDYPYDSFFKILNLPIIYQQPLSRKEEAILPRVPNEKLELRLDKRLIEIVNLLLQKNITFLLLGDAIRNGLFYIKSNKATIVVSDESALAKLIKLGATLHGFLKNPVVYQWNHQKLLINFVFTKKYTPDFTINAVTTDCRFIYDPYHVLKNGKVDTAFDFINNESMITLRDILSAISLNLTYPIFLPNKIYEKIHRLRPSLSLGHLNKEALGAISSWIINHLCMLQCSRVYYLLISAGVDTLLFPPLKKEWDENKKKTYDKWILTSLKAIKPTPENRILSRQEIFSIIAAARIMLEMPAPTEEALLSRQSFVPVPAGFEEYCYFQYLNSNVPENKEVNTLIKKHLRSLIHFEERSNSSPRKSSSNPLPQPAAAPFIPPPPSNTFHPLPFLVTAVASPIPTATAAPAAAALTPHPWYFLTPVQSNVTLSNKHTSPQPSYPTPWDRKS